ncbi:uncharacterized protein si:ch211-137a8.4 [Conger conger]|uniref:uncharacterized protein si:ch211-137a8.4 n=1 Tax=Conger conger TaxID=82655 RepID=UPI002A59C683|nr:uncharacterized protein si:ch211-137a8.4 [Conger conger]
MAATASASPMEGDGCENVAEVQAAVLESATGPAEEEQTAGEAMPASDQHPTDGKSKPASEKIWGSFLKNSGLGKVMGGRKKKEQVAGGVDASVEGVEQEKTTTNQEEGASTPLSPNEQGSGQAPNMEGAGSQEKCIEKELDGEEAAQEQKPSSSSKDAKPKQGEKSSVRDFIRKPVAKIFSHRSTEKKDCGAEAPKHGKTRSKSLDRLEDPEACASALDQTDDSQVGGEPHKSAHHSARHMKRWHSFKKLMAQKSLKKSTEDHKDVEGAEGAEGPSSDTQLESETLDSAGKLDHTGQRRWKLKRSWTFQGLKRDPSVVGIHKPKGSEKDSLDNPKGEDTHANDDQGAVASSEETKSTGEAEMQEKGSQEREEEKGLAAQRTKSVDHHANEIWTTFKKRVIPKSKRASDGGGGTGGGGEEEGAGEHEQAEDQSGREHGKSSKSKRTHFNRAVSLKNFIMRKGKSTSVDLGEAPAGQKEEGAESTGDTSASAPVTENIKEGESPADQAVASEPEAPAAIQNGGDEKTEAVDTNRQTSTGQESEKGHPDTKEEAQAEPALEAACGETKGHKENGSSGAGCDRKGSAMEGEDENHKDIMAHDHEIIPQEDGPQEIATQEDINSQEAVHQIENACCSGSKDEASLNQEQCSDGKTCSGNPVPQSEKMAGKVKPHKEH